jgi:hypothetical protein
VAASNYFEVTSRRLRLFPIPNNQAASKANRGIYSFNLQIPEGGGGIFLPLAKKWGGLFVLGDCCANIDQI